MTLNARKAAVAIVILCISGCSFFDDDKEDRWERTPRGNRVEWMGRGSLSSNPPRFSKADAFRWFDQAVDQAVKSIVETRGVPRNRVLEAVGSCYYQLVDDRVFEVATAPADFPDAKFATGLTVGNLIRTCLWSTGEAPDRASVPSDAPAWTIRSGTVSGRTVWRYGVLDTSNPYPSLVYELGNVLGINR